jgi:prepilin-type N-terminal cleavage/methylation domain-containing protein
MDPKGFTLIELLIVVVIIGLLATIALPKLANTKEKAYVASMKSDLRNLVTAEEGYFAGLLQYSATTDCTNPPAAGAVPYCTSPGNTLGPINTGGGGQGQGQGQGQQQGQGGQGGSGWTVSVTNANTTKRCAIYVGTVTPAAPATPTSPEGVPVCQ